MTIKDWFISLFKNGTQSVTLDMFIGELTSEIFFKELAVQACINLISNAVARSEFQTFEKGKEVRKDNYYLFNVEPNPNKSASKFWRDVIHHLVYDNECLIVQQDGHFYVADSFNVRKFAFQEYIYTDVVIDDFQLNKSFVESEVFHLELHNEEIKNVIDGLYRSYSKLIEASQQNYKRNNSRRGKMKIPTNYPQTEEAQKQLEDLFKNKFKRFFEAENGAVLPLPNNLEYEELSSNIGVKGGADNKEIRSFIDDIFDFVAIAFQVPPQLLKGTVADTDKAVGNFLTFCVNPLAELLTDEINRKYYKKRAFLDRTYVKLNTSMIRAVDIKDIAGALETLFRIGGYTIDDVLKSLGMEPLDNGWSTTHFVTKNYEPIEHSIENSGGG